MFIMLLKIENLKFWGKKTWGVAEYHFKLAIQYAKFTPWVAQLQPSCLTFLD